MFKKLSLSALALTALLSVMPLTDAYSATNTRTTGDPVDDAQNAALQQMQSQIQQLEQRVQELQQFGNALIQCGAKGKIYNGRICQDPVVPGISPNDASGYTGTVPLRR